MIMMIIKTTLIIVMGVGRRAKTKSHHLLGRAASFLGKDVAN